MSQMNLYVCHSHSQEYLDAFNSLESLNLRISTYPSHCTGEGKNQEGKSDFLEEPTEDSAIIVSKTCSMKAFIRDKYPGINIYELDHCYDNLIDLPCYEKLLKQQSYIVTDSWLGMWESNIQNLGFNDESIKDYFSSWCNKIVYLNSGNNPDYKSKLDDLSIYLGLPYEIHKISLSNTRNIIENIYLKWQIAKKEELNRNKIHKMQMRIAESEAVRGLINEVMTIDNRQDLLQRLSHLWSMLFGVQKAEYNIFERVIPFDQKNIEPYLWDSQSNIMTCNLLVNNHYIGSCYLNKFTFPEKVGQYHDLIINLINISSIMISNVMEMERVISSEKTLKLTFDSVNNGIISVNSNGQIKYINTNAMKFLDLNPMDDSSIYNGMNIDDLFIHKLVVLRNLYLHVHESQSTQRLEKNLEIQKRNSTIFLDCSVSPIITQHEFKGVVFVFRDVSHEKTIFENRLKIERLEGLSVLSASIAHDFNNLLTAVSGYTSLTKRTLPAVSKGFQYIEKAEKAIDLAVNLSNKLVTFSDGGMPQKESIDLNSLLQSALESQFLDIPMLWETDFEREIPPISLDKRQFTILINSLLHNAIDAVSSNPKVKSIKIRTFVTHNDPMMECDTVGISIADNGCGIPSEHISKIYDPMYTSKYKAMGLGLTIAQSIVLKHSGLLSVESDLDTGSEFKIIFPLSAS